MCIPLYRREHDHSQPPVPDRKVVTDDGAQYTDIRSGKGRFAIAASSGHAAIGTQWKFQVARHVRFRGNSLGLPMCGNAPGYGTFF
jgi:hypothetical protein